MVCIHMPLLALHDFIWKTFGYSCIHDCVIIKCSVSTSLPSTIDSTVAINAFSSQHNLLLNLIRHCLPSLASSLYAKSMIPEDIKEKACNQNLGSNERGVALLDSVQSKLEGEPSNFSKFVAILESEPYLRSQAEQLVKNYCESF